MSDADRDEPPAERASPPRIPTVRRESVREEPYFASPLIACPACGYLATLGLPSCPRCFLPLPRPVTRVALVVAGVAGFVAGGVIGLLVSLPWFATALAGAIAMLVWKRRGARPAKHPGQPM